MIFYFTGTGNSYHVAKELGKDTNERLVFMPEALAKKQYEYKVGTKESIGFVFPVYYWGLPTIVEEFIKKLKILNGENHFVYAVVTCGASIGTTMTRFGKILHKVGMTLDSGYSLLYPDNYVLLYDVPTKEEQVAQCKEGDLALQQVKQEIASCKKGVFQVTRGAAPHLLSGILHLYYKRNRKTKAFYANEACTNCGLCSCICPTRTITLSEEGPVWGKECTQCLGCIHRCPVQAIQYGKKTKKRGRYVHPDLLACKETKDR